MATSTLVRRIFDVERNGLAINKSATSRVQETATLKVADYLINSALRAVHSIIPSGSVRK